MAPLEALPPLLVLIIWSVVTGIVMAVVFRCTSNQKALAKLANETSANILANVISASSITELNELEIVMQAIFMHVVEVGHGSVSSIKRFGTVFKAIFLSNHGAMFIRLPINIVAQKDSS